MTGLIYTFTNKENGKEYVGQLKYAYSDLCAPVPSIAPLYCSPFTSYGTGMYAGTAASNFNAVNTAINTVTGGCPSCTAQ